MQKKKTTRYFDTSTEESKHTAEPNDQKQNTQKRPRKRSTPETDGEEPKWKKDFLKSREKSDPFEGPAPIPEKRIQKYKRGKKNKLVSCLSPGARINQPIYNRGTRCYMGF